MKPIVRIAMSIAALITAGSLHPAHAGGHTWRVKEIFSNADGTIQYIEVWEANGTPGEVGTANHNVTSNSHVFTIPSNVASPTTFKSLLLATQGFADLDVVDPDYIIADNFFSLTADTIRYVPYDTMTFTAGQLPTDGVSALARNLAVVVNSPSNYAGDTGSIDVSAPGPPAVPATGSDPLLVARAGALPDGSHLLLSFDTTTCTGNTGHQVLYGFGSMLPTTPGGAFGVGGAVCAVAGSPFDWENVPDPAADASRVLWFLVQATDGSATEGSWGTDGDGAERIGPGTNGSSAQCQMSDKDLGNSCGH